MVRILGRANSINVQKVMWLAAEIGCAVERVDIGGAFGGNDTPEYLAKNPNGLVPTMEDGDLILWESNAICRYLAEAYGAAPWQPADAARRGLAGQWMDWYLTRMHPPMTTIFWQLVRTKPEDRDTDGLAKAAKQAGEYWTIVDRQLEGRDFITGAEPNVGDVPVGCSLNRWFQLDVERPKLARLEAYYERLRERPAYRKHVVDIVMT